jgi:hypothetical protein
MGNNDGQIEEQLPTGLSVPLGSLKSKMSM